MEAPKTSFPGSAAYWIGSKLQIIFNYIIKYLDVGPQAQLPPPYAEDISALLTMVLS